MPITDFRKTDLRDVQDDVAIVEFQVHSRYRAYPQNITLSTLVSAVAVANTFGGWTEIIPLNTVPFPFHIIGFCACQVSAATMYFIQFGYNTINADPGTNMEMGERRFRIATVPIAKASELMEIRGQGIPANSRVMARMKTASGAADTANISVVLTRHIDVEREVSLYPAFPW